MMYAKKSLVVLTLCGFVVAGCETKAGTGAVVGGVGGAAVGGLIGSSSHGRAGEGALIGGAIGALGGALVGNSMDKNDEKKKKQEQQEAQKYRERESQPAQTPPPAPANSNSVTRADVISWHNAGVKDDIIIDRIQRSGQTFTVTATDEQQLRQSGVSGSVITAMKNNR